MPGEKQSNGVPQQQPNGQTSVLSTLAQSSNQWVQLATVGLVALSGFGNFSATWNSADRNKEEIEVSRRVAFEGEQRIRAEVAKQVAEIHNWMRDATDEFHKGNADSAANKKMLVDFKDEVIGFEKRQLTALDNQKEIIRVKGQILTHTHEIVERFERWKKLEQQRGAPE